MQLYVIDEYDKNSITVAKSVTLKRIYYSSREMKDNSFKRLFSLFLIILCFVSVCEAQSYKRSIRNPERELFGRSLNNKSVKYRESPSVVRAKKKQAAKEKKLKKDYGKYVKKSRKHAIEIQSREVQARMLENSKNADSKYKEKKRIRTANSKKAGRKYKQ